MDTSRIQVATGSVLGREHARLGRNNQDAVACVHEPGIFVAAVADGCSAGRSSEVGARLGVGFLTTQAARMGRDGFDPHELVRRLEVYLRTVARGIVGGTSLPAVVQDHLLFGFLCVVVTPARTVLFGIGDGAWSIDGRLVAIDPGPANAPSYVAYELLPRSALTDARSITTTVHADLPTDAWRSIALCTDGVLDLERRAAEPLADGTCASLATLEGDGRHFLNPTLLHKRLTVIGERNRRLPDDTTIVLLRKELPCRS